ncbi:MAG: ABC transporter permease, partial [Chloroflexota bacterium]
MALAIWQVLAWARFWTPVLFPSPGRVLAALVELLVTGRLISDLEASTARLLLGSIVAAAVAIPL